MDKAKEIFAFEDGGVIVGLLAEHGVAGRDVENRHFGPQAVFESIVG